MESILETVKKTLGINTTYTVFDDEIIVHINSVFMILYQMGIVDTPFVITGSTEKWTDALGTDIKDMEMIKTYVGLKVRTMFDIPTSSVVLGAMNETIKELEYRMYVWSDNRKNSETSD